MRAAGPLWVDAAAVMSAAAWLVLVAARGRFWTTSVRLPPAAGPAAWPDVAVVVPARNEADLLPSTLPTLLGQRYPGRLRIVVADDGSTDGTAAVARALATRAQVRCNVVAVPPRPAAWAGKVWAQAAALPYVRDAAWVLLTDADIAHPPDSVARLVAHALADRRDLVSLMARLRIATLWERLLVPAFVYFFAQLYPFRRVNGGRVAAAAGGCVLARRALLDSADWPAAVHDAVIDDVALARVARRAGGRLWLGLADDVRSVRPYPRLGDLWQMVARSAYAQLRRSPPALLGTVLGLLLVYAAPPATCLGGLITGDANAAVAGGVGWLLLTASYLPQLRYARQPAVLALTLPAVAVLYLLMTVDSARRHHLRRPVGWRDPPAAS